MIKNKYSTRFKATLLAFLLPASGIMTAYAITYPQPAQTDFKVERISEELPAVYVETNTYQSSYWAQEAVQAGDSLADVLTRMGVNQEDIKQIMAKNNANLDMKNLRTNQSVNIRIDSSGQVTDVQFFTDEELERNLVALEKVKGKWRISNAEIDMKTMPTLRSVQIRTSAIGDMLRAEIPSEVYIQLKEIFADSFNMSDLGEGDTVRLLYNSMYFRGQQMAVGDILAAEVVKDGKTYQAYYYSQAKATKKAVATTTKTVSPCNKKKALIPSLLHTRAFLLRSATVSTRFCIPSVCTPVSTMPRRPVRRLRPLPTAK